MICAVSAPEQREAFARCLAGQPYFQSVMATDLALWADNPGAPVRLYTMPGAALSVLGREARLCGIPEDGEELASFLRFAGVERLLCSGAPPASWRRERPLYLYSLPAGQQTPETPLPPEGMTLDRVPSMTAVADLLFARDTAQWDCFYTTACTSINHGFGDCRALWKNGKMAAAVGCFERANGEAYVSGGFTAKAQRGQGIGGWLILHLFNELAAEGWNVLLLCEEHLCGLYDRKGLVQTGIYYNYITEWNNT